MSDYVSVIYDEKAKPRTNYPFELASYLYRRFNFKKGNKILEIGCGRGEFLEAFKKLGLECYGTDISDVSVQKLSHFNVKLADILKERLPHEDNMFDVVYHKSLIEHLYFPENLMKESHRVLKPGGKVVILTPDWVSQMRVFYEDFTHSRPYDRTSLHNLLKVYKFSDIKTELFYQLPALWKYPFLKVLSILLRLIIPTHIARNLTKLTKIKFIRWSVELMILGTGIK